jgi:acetyl-CoA carboxylase carboxyl transferase subunit beta
MTQATWRTAKGFTPTDRPANIPEKLWVKCPACAKLIYIRQLHDEHNVCPGCSYHFRLTPHAWIDLLLDPQSFCEHDAALISIDPLHFGSGRDAYSDKLQQLAATRRLNESMLTGSGRIDGQPIEIAIANFEFMGGSMGSVYGEKLARAAERAADRRTPLITLNASGGARMQEGIFSLMQMAKVSVALTLLAQMRQLHISVLIDPCYGGVSASYASVADIILSEPGAHIGFAGRRVIEQTIRQQLPPDFQTAEFLLAHGLLDDVVPRSELRPTLSRLLRIHERRTYDEPA